MISTLDQWTQVVETLESDLSRLEQAIIQKMTQQMALVQQQWAHLLGIDTNTSTTSSNTAAPQTASNSGSGNGSSSPNLGPIVDQNNGSGTISGTKPRDAASTLAQPLTSSSASVIPYYGTGSGTVSGQVWLDNNGNGTQENGEVGLSGITVNLDSLKPGGGVVLTTTTDANGNYQFQLNNGLFNLPQQYEIQVVLPSGDEGTIQGAASNINVSGYSPAFTLNPNAAVIVPAGLRSMVVTTTQDDPNGAIPKEITLRDAIETGNNGGGPAVTFAQGVTGVISLQKALDNIEKSYSITGPGDTTLAVEGNGNASNPYRIFGIISGVTSTISGLMIEGGYVQNDNGAGIDNEGDLTLSNDDIEDNQATTNGGGAGTGGGFITLVPGNYSYKRFLLKKIQL
jgi:hypothetical protein